MLRIGNEIATSNSMTTEAFEYKCIYLVFYGQFLNYPDDKNHFGNGNSD